MLWVYGSPKNPMNITHMEHEKNTGVYGHTWSFRNRVNLLVASNAEEHENYHIHELNVMKDCHMGATPN